MAWNRPENGEAASSPLQRKGETSAMKRRGHRFPIVVAGAIVVFGAAIAAWWLWPDASVPVAEDGDGAVERRIREVKPAVARTNVASVAKKVQLKEQPPQRAGEVRDGYIMFADGSKARCQGVITSSVDNSSLINRTFSKFSDRLIAHLVTLEPGTGMLGSSEELYRDFDAEFDESLKDEITITPEDTEEQQELKREIMELRKELKARKAEGESLAKLMADTRNKFMELAAYRDDLEREVESLLADKEFSEKEEDELIKAANLMLEDRGIKPFELPSAAKYYIEKQFNPNR